MAVTVNIDELRTKTAAEIVVFARETFGKDITGNKAQLIAQIKKIMEEQADQQASEGVLTREVVLENIRQGLVTKDAPATPLVYNKATGMVFRNHAGLHSNPNLVAFKGDPVLVIHKGKQAVMHPAYVRELFALEDIVIEALDQNLNPTTTGPAPRREEPAAE